MKPQWNECRMYVRVSLIGFVNSWKAKSMPNEIWVQVADFLCVHIKCNHPLFCTCCVVITAFDSHQVFSKSKTLLTWRDCGDNERIDLQWTTTSWAVPYVSTTRKASSASPTCLRDWSTSLFTQYETASKVGGEDRGWWDGNSENYKDKLCHHAPEHLIPETKRWHGTCALNYPDGTHLTANTEVTAGSCCSLICAKPARKRQKQCSCWGFFLLQN